MTDQELIDLLARENERLEVECERMRAVVEAAVEWQAASEAFDDGRWRQAVGGLHFAMKCYRAPVPPTVSEEGMRDG